MTGMPRRDWSTATCWIAFVISAHAFGVFTAGEAPPPERTDPTDRLTSTWSIDSELSGPRSQSLAGSPCSLRTSTWVICPAFSARVMRPSRSVTRWATGSFAFIYGGVCAWLAAARDFEGDAHAVAADSTAISTARAVSPRAGPRAFRAADRGP